MSKDDAQAGPPPRYVSPTPYAEYDFNPTSPALSATLEPKQPQQVDEDAWWRAMSDQEVVDKLVEATGEGDILMVILYLFALDKKEALRNKVNWHHSRLPVTALVAASAKDEAKNRLIIQLLLLCGASIPSSLLRQSPHSEPYVTPWALQTFRLWEKNVDIGFEMARSLLAMGPWAAEQYMKDHEDFLNGVRPPDDRPPVFRPNPAFVPSHAVHQRQFDGSSDIKPNVGGAGGGKILNRNKSKKKQSRWKMPPTGSTLAPSASTPSFGPVAQASPAPKVPIDVAPTKRQAAKVVRKGGLGGGEGGKKPAAPKKPPMPKKPPAPKRRYFEVESPEEDSQAPPSTPGKRQRVGSGDMASEARPSVAKRDMRVKTGEGQENGEEVVSDSQGEAEGLDEEDRFGGLDLNVHVKSRHLDSDINTPSSAYARPSTSPIASSTTVYPFSRSTTPATPSFPFLPSFAGPVPSFSNTQLSPADLETIRLSEVIKLEIGEAVYQKELDFLVLAKMKGEQAPSSSSAETMLEAYAIELEVGKERYAEEVKRVKLRAMKGQ